MTIDEARKLLTDVRPYFYRYAEPVKVYLHWTAGDYETTYDDYHFCIAGNGQIVNTRSLKEIPSATEGRNTGSIAISLCCCADAIAYRGEPNYADLGHFPPTVEQIETLACLMAVIADVFHIPITIDHFLTHGEAGDNMDGWEATEKYGMNSGCTRWDLAVLDDETAWGDGGNVLRGKAIWYQHHGG